MNVTEAINKRHAVRAFLPNGVEKEKLNAVLEAAARTPSWGNSQPWELFVATGETLRRIKKGYQEKYERKVVAAPEIPHPKEWTEAAKKRRQQLHPGMVRDCGEVADQFGLLNRAMFYAPAVIYLCLDKILSEWSLYDIGAYAQSLMLAAVDQGLSTMPAITLVHYPDVLRRELKISGNLKIAIGIAVGYADQEHKINNFVSERNSLGDQVHFFD